MKELTLREKVVVKMLLICCQIICGKSFDGGLEGDVLKQIIEIRRCV